MANIKRANASSITKSGVAIADVPDAPTIGAVADLLSGSTASVAYTAAVTGGAATTFTATSSPGGFTGTGSSPITVSGLSSGTAYTFTVTASNSTGTSAPSSTSSSLTLAAVGAFESIASATGTGSNTTITFSSIPQTYKHLQIRALYKDTYSGVGFATYELQFNGATTGYSHHKLYGDGTSALSTGNVDFSSIDGFIGPTSYSTQADMYGVAVVDIHDYASTSKNKTIRSISGSEMSSGNTNSQIRLVSGLWQSTSAINSITIHDTAYYFVSGTTFALYGIKG